MKKIKFNKKFLFIPVMFGLFIQTATAQYENPSFIIKPAIKTKIASIEKKLNKKIVFDFAEISKENKQSEKYKLLVLEGTEYISVELSTSKKIIIKLDKSLKEDKRKAEILIEHTLLHLGLTADSFPNFFKIENHHCLTESVPDPFISNLLHTLIEHHLERKKLKDSGFRELIEFEKTIIENTREHLKDFDFETRSLNYAWAILEFEDAENLEKIKRFYTADGFEAEMKKGEMIANLIIEKKFNTPELFVKSFSEVLQKIYPEQEPFEIRPFSSLKKFGNEFNFYHIFARCLTKKGI